jgi:hypothetical protein
MRMESNPGEVLTGRPPWGSGLLNLKKEDTMRSISRRSLLGSVPVAAATVLSAADKKAPAKVMKLGGRVHPLDGIARENIKITDLKVTLLSAEIPKDRQWYSPRTIVWKSDAVLVQIFTDKEIRRGTPMAVSGHSFRIRSIGEVSMERNGNAGFPDFGLLRQSDHYVFAEAKTDPGGKNATRIKCLRFRQ